jgi:hypothetical protein
MPTRIARPAPGEYAPDYAAYVAGVPGDDALPELASQLAVADRLFKGLPEERALHRYAPGKWSVKVVVGHLTDSERVFAYRALRFARNDPTPLPNFDEDLYALTGQFDRRPMSSLLDELQATRHASLTLFRSLDDEALGRTGVARGLHFSVRALAWLTAGHMRHHFGVLRERYGLG